MRDYSFAKIYKIEPISGGDIGDCYYGSTTEKHLSQRMTHHRCGYRRWKEEKTKYTTASSILLEKYGIDNCQIILVETVENCESKDELFVKESYYIKNFQCINKQIPARKNKEYREDNKDKLTAYIHQYYNDNKEKLIEYQHQYNEENIDKVKETQKKYCEEHRDELKEKRKTYYLEHIDERKEKDKKIKTRTSRGIK